MITGGAWIGLTECERVGTSGSQLVQVSLGLTGRVVSHIVPVIVIVSQLILLDAGLMTVVQASVIPYVRNQNTNLINHNVLHGQPKRETLTLTARCPI